MEALVFVAPSAAAIVWAFVWLQHTRDKRLNDKQAMDINANTVEVARLWAAHNEHEDMLVKAAQQAKQHEQQISQLTDKAFR